MMKSKYKTFLVTGGAGLIGLEICKQLSDLGCKTHLFDLGEQIARVKEFIPKNVKLFHGSIGDRSSLRSAMYGCDIIIHLGALLGVKRSEGDKLRCIEININGTNNVLDCAVQHRVKKVVFASSSEVYGEPQINPINEKTITQGKTVYAITKLAGEELCKAYNQRYAINYTILRYFNCYGPHQTAQFVISKFIKAVLGNKSPVINGDGKQIRSYTYVTDTAKATIMAALNDDTNNHILNIGHGQSPISLTDLAEKIIELAGKKGKIKPIYAKNFQKTDRLEEREIFERFCDSTKSKNLLNWSPTISIDEGLKSVIKEGYIYDGWINYEDDEM